MRDNLAAVLSRAAKARERKQSWLDEAEDAYEFALPQRNLFGGNYESPGRKKTTRLFDSTAINSTQRFANRLQSALFPPYRHWCALVPGDDIPEEDRDEMNLGLDIYTERLFSVLRQTNFDLAISEFLMDLAVGTAVMLIQPGDEDMPVRFEAVPQYLVALEGGKDNTIDTVYRTMRLKAEVIEQQWPDATIPSALADIIRDKPSEEIELLEATIYKTVGDYYCYHVIWEKQREELVFREIASSPWIVCRWSVCAGEHWGRGPLLTALPDIRTLNHTKRTLLESASINLAGMYTVVDDGVVNLENIKIQPGMMIPVARNGGPQGESIRRLPAAGDVNLGQLVINDLTMSIKKIMLDDTLPPDDMSARSATEIQARLSELASNIGSAFGRMITEAMIPIVQRTLRVMDMENLVDMTDLRVDGRIIKVVPVSPLAKAQNMEELESVMQFLQFLQGFGPAGMIAVNQEKTLAFIADRLGVPARILSTPEERAALMAQMQEAAEAQAAAQAQGQMAQGAAAA